MNAATNPNEVVALLGIALLVLAGGWLLIQWVRAASPGPEPWDVETAAALETEDATPICHRCLTPHANEAWFCEHCGSAVGPYNNLMPFVNVFSEGEVFRNGVTDNWRASPLMIGGYLLFSLSAYLVFAPIYWFFLFRNLRQHEDHAAAESAEGDG